MNKIKTLIGVAALVLATVINTQAQTNQLVPMPYVTVQPQASSFLDGLQTMEQSVTSGTNWSAVVGYGHSMKGNNSLEFGDVAYAFNENLGAVVGYDALQGSGVSQFNSVKGGLTLKTEIYPFKWTGIAALEKIPGQPFVGDLIATAKDGSIGNIVTTGINFNVYQIKNFNLDVGVQYELRAGEGVFNGNYALFHIGISRSF